VPSGPQATWSIHFFGCTAISSILPLASIAMTRPSSPVVISRSPSSVRAAASRPPEWTSCFSADGPLTRATLPSPSAKAGSEPRNSAATT